MARFRYGKVDRVKKIKDYAFVHFEEVRDDLIIGTHVSRLCPLLM